MFWCRRLRRPPSTPYQFFIAAVYFDEVVVLGDRDVDDLVGVDERRVDRPLVEHLALQAHLAEAMLGRQDHLGAERVRRAPDARALEAAVRLVARGVGDDDLLGAGVEGELDDLGDDRGFVFAAWIGMRSQPMFGLIATMSPREMKRFMPPSASTARRTSSPGSVAALGDRHRAAPFGRGLRAGSRAPAARLRAWQASKPAAIPSQACRQRAAARTAPVSAQALERLAARGAIGHRRVEPCTEGIGLRQVCGFQSRLALEFAWNIHRYCPRVRPERMRPPEAQVPPLGRAPARGGLEGTDEPGLSFPLPSSMPRSSSMKDGIHPDYNVVRVTCACGNSFETRSTVPEMSRRRLLAACHPFYTGKQRLVDTQGRVDRFRRKYGQTPKRRRSSKVRRRVGSGPPRQNPQPGFGCDRQSPIGIRA